MRLSSLQEFALVESAVFLTNACFRIAIMGITVAVRNEMQSTPINLE